MWESLFNHRWNEDWRGIFSILAFALAMAFIFQSWELALQITASLAIHELGHILMLSYYGIEWEIGFGVVGAWTKSPYNKRQALGHFENSLIHLAGPLFSLFYALFAVGLHFMISPNNGDDYWLRLANFSAWIGLLNLLPMGQFTDGGKFLRRMLDSINRKAEQNLLWLLVIWTFSLLWIEMVTPHNLMRVLAMVSIGGWVVMRLWLGSTQDDPIQVRSPKAMTRKQAGTLFFSLMLMLVAFTVLSFRTPFWLSETQVLNMASNFISTSVYLIYESSIGLRFLVVSIVSMLALFIGRGLVKRGK